MGYNDYMKKTKSFVGAGIIGGVGNVALGQMGQGAIAGKMSKGYNMLGATMSASYGMGIVKMLNKKSKSKKPKYKGY